MPNSMEMVVGRTISGWGKDRMVWDRPRWDWVISAILSPMLDFERSAPLKVSNTEIADTDSRSLIEQEGAIVGIRG